MKKRQVPKGRKKPRGYGQPVVPVDEIVKRLRKSPPRPPRRPRRR